MSTVPAPVKRHALGLPAGSVRALHLLLVVGLICLSLVLPSQRDHAIPPYLVLLLLMMLGHYFGARGHHAPGEPNPLHLPRGVIRLLIMFGLAGVIGWKVYSDPDRVLQQFRLTMDALKAEPTLPLLILGGFFGGVLVRMVIGRDNPPMWWQDVEAWLSLVATLGLCVAALIELVINPSLEQPVSWPHWEGILAAVVAFYFGARS